MKFLADESVDKQIVDCLREEGYSENDKNFDFLVSLENPF